MKPQTALRQKRHLHQRSQKSQRLGLRSRMLWYDGNISKVCFKRRTLHFVRLEYFVWGWRSSFSGSTIRTLLHGKINPDDWQVLSLGDVGFLLLFRVVSGDYGKPCSFPSWCCPLPAFLACLPAQLVSDLVFQLVWDAVSVLWACLQNFMCDSWNCLGSMVV